MNEETEIVHVEFHHEDGSWWADSPELPSLFAGDPDLEEARRLVRQVVHEEIGPSASIVFWMPAPSSLASVVSSRGDSGSGKVHHEPGTWPEPAPSPILSETKSDPITA